MTDFLLLRPGWLLALPLLPLLWFALSHFQRRQQQWQRLVPKHLQRAMLVSPQAQPQPRLWWPWMVAALALIALAGPSWQKQQVPVFQLHQGRVVVMDMSYSMYATDLLPNRLTQARFKAIDLIRRFDEGETALVAFAGDAFALSPMTDDKETLLNLVPNLSPEIMPVPGSDLPSALTLANQLLKDAGYRKGEIILFIDGLNPEHTEEALRLAASYPWTLQVYALGTEAGAPMRASSGELIKSRSGEVVVAQTDLGLLATLAAEGSGQLVTYDNGDDDINRLSQRVSSEETDKDDNRQHTSQWQDMGVYLIPLLLLPAAVSLRRHWLMVLLPLLILPPPGVHAAWWHSPQAEARQLLDQRQFAEAAERLPEGGPRADALYRAGDYRSALSEYRKLPQTAQSLYNQGNALARLQQLQPAMEAYRQALKLQPGLTQARENLALLERLQQQSQQQQDNNQQQEESASQEQGGQGDDPSQEDASASQHDSPESPASALSNSSSTPPRPQEQRSQTPPSEDGGDQEDQQESQAAPPPGDGEAQSPQSPAAGQTAQAQQNGEPQEQPLDLKQLERVQDDPSLLLRNKMKLEYERRRRAGKINEERTQW
ncbi:VWA domain-containing protein [Ferrimonas sediminicola]|uniref:VWA domain-containing protein n=1 Tax=Ferrimonas sediminicola TaxID=2569538 RepID=A0A4U1BH75_9GAMM|nr:VWA domain-containing protein [Ferrimonas sediminicola]TKB49825.1 VWA domain-containing protein [Ferrimonas sediminicola]